MNTPRFASALFVAWLVFQAIVMCAFGEDATTRKPQSLGQRIDHAEYKLHQTAMRVDIMYDMVKALYLETHTEREYEELVFGSRKTKEVTQ